MASSAARTSRRSQSSSPFTDRTVRLLYCFPSIQRFISTLSPVTEDFDYCFAENGLTAIKLGKPLGSESFIGFIGEDKYKKLVTFILHYIADLDIPVKRCVPEGLLALL